jgi:hypothetical protein
MKASIISDSFYGEQKFTILADYAPLNNERNSIQSFLSQVSFFTVCVKLFC